MAIVTFLALSDIVGPNAMGWRYDPIFLNEKYTIDYHLKSFEHMAARLSGATKTCVISFIDLYQKVRKNFPEVRSVPKNERIFLGKKMIEIAAGCGMTIRPLCRYCYANYDERTVHENDGQMSLFSNF